MKKNTIILCVIAVLGIAYFDDIKNMFTGDDEKARIIMQEYMERASQKQSSNSEGELLIEQSSAGNYDGIPSNTGTYSDDVAPRQETSSGGSRHQSRPKSCNTCMGTGRCRKCGGDGIATGFTRDARVQCASCYGKGVCPTCQGSGQQ